MWNCRHWPTKAHWRCWHRLISKFKFSATTLGFGESLLNFGSRPMSDYVGSFISNARKVGNVWIAVESPLFLTVQELFAFPVLLPPSWAYVLTRRYVRQGRRCHRRAWHGRKCAWGSRWNHLTGTFSSIVVSTSSLGGRHIKFWSRPTSENVDSRPCHIKVRPGQNMG